MISITKWFSIVFKGVDISRPAYWYQHLTPTKRKFVFFGLQIKWVMIGVVVVKKDEKKAELSAKALPIKWDGLR
jgi:hypothetical protein